MRESLVAAKKNPHQVSTAPPEPSSKLSAHYLRQHDAIAIPQTGIRHGSVNVASLLPGSDQGSWSEATAELLPPRMGYSVPVPIFAALMH
jgi:hypothetical protein